MRATAPIVAAVARALGVHDSAAAVLMAVYEHAAPLHSERVRLQAGLDGEVSVTVHVSRLRAAMASGGIVASFQGDSSYLLTPEGRNEVRFILTTIADQARSLAA